MEHQSNSRLLTFGGLLIIGIISSIAIAYYTPPISRSIGFIIGFGTVIMPTYIFLDNIFQKYDIDFKEVGKLKLVIAIGAGILVFPNALDYFHGEGGVNSYTQILNNPHAKTTGVLKDIIMHDAVSYKNHEGHEFWEAIYDFKVLDRIYTGNAIFHKSKPKIAVGDTLSVCYLNDNPMKCIAPSLVEQ